MSRRVQTRPPPRPPAPRPRAGSGRPNRSPRGSAASAPELPRARRRSPAGPTRSSRRSSGPAPTAAARPPRRRPVPTGPSSWTGCRSAAPPRSPAAAPRGGRSRPGRCRWPGPPLRAIPAACADVLRPTGHPAARATPRPAGPGAVPPAALPAAPLPRPASSAARRSLPVGPPGRVVAPLAGPPSLWTLLSGQRPANPPARRADVPPSRHWRCRPWRPAGSTVAAPGRGPGIPG